MTNETVPTVAVIDTAPPPAPARKCDLAQALNTTLIHLLVAAPTNPVVRTQVLAAIKQPLPDAVLTFDAIKEWIELNIAPSVAAPQPTGGRNRAAFTIGVSCSEAETGTARYRVQRTGTTEESVTERMINAALQDAETLDEVLDNLQEAISDAVNDNPPSLESDGDYDYDRHESAGSDGLASSFSRGALERNLRDWLQANRPEDYEQLVG